MEVIFVPATKHGPDEGGIWERRILTAFAFALLYQVLVPHIFVAGFAEVKGPKNIRKGKNRCLFPPLHFI